MLFIALGASIRTFVNYLQPLLIIDAAHLKDQYKGTNLIAVSMDGNNQIVPIAFGICKGETSPCWSWWMSVPKECIVDNPSLLFISDRHAVIALAVQNKFPLAYHAARSLLNMPGAWGYCDAGFETDRDDTKSQTGYVFVLNGGAVDWKSSKQSTTAMSATESEYIAASEAAMEAVTPSNL
ncbi:transposase, MuDR, MULE transposase domain protein, partial [Tanacetum coccineum]